MSRQDYERAEKLFEKGTVALRYLDEKKTDLTVKEQTLIVLKLLLGATKKLRQY